jgi:4-hydroxybenzoate polyprenyltransferase
VYLRLGRVSNLPTVWSNVVAGIALGGGHLGPSAAVVALAASLFYVGGMFLNDAFDHRHDARSQPTRPIPAGLIGAREVYRIGFGLLAAGALLMVGCALALDPARAARTAGAALALGASIVLYDAWHKGNAVGPVIMGTCRMLVYVCAALITADAAGARLGIGAAALLAYLIGLTYAAKQESLARVGSWWPLVFLGAPIGATLLISGPMLLVRPLVWLLLPIFALWVVRAVRILVARGPGSVPRAVVALIAGISLCDALFAAATGATVAGAVAALALPVTLLLQRWVKGT